MKFHIISLLAFIGLMAPAFAAPGAIAVEIRQANLITTISNAVAQLQTSVGQDLGAIVTVVTQTASVFVAQVFVAVPAILARLADLIGAIQQAIVTLAPAIANAVVGLTMAEVQALVTNLSIVQAIVQNISNVIANTLTSLYPAALALISAELTALINVLNPFVIPLIIFSQQAVSTVAGAQGLAGQMNATSTSIATILQGILAPLGLVL